LPFSANAIGTALLLDHVRALLSAGLARSTAIGLLGVVTVTQAICVLGGGVLVDRYGTHRVGMLGLLLLGLTTACIASASGLIGGIAYAATLGGGLGILHVVQGTGQAEHFGTATSRQSARNAISAGAFSVRRPGRCLRLVVAVNQLTSSFLQRSRPLWHSALALFLARRGYQLPSLCASV